MSAEDSANSGGAGSSLSVSTDSSNVDILKLLYDKYALYEEYLDAETMIALSDINRLNKIRDMRDEARMQFEKMGKSELSSSNFEHHKLKSIFHNSFEITERSDALGVLLPPSDEGIRERSKLVNYKHIDSLSKSQQQLLSAQKELIASRASAKDRQALKEDLKEYPAAIKELLLELPSYPATFPPPDRAYCMSLIRAAVLPISRPVLSEDAQLGKRKKEDDDDDETENTGFSGANNNIKYDDIFRIRARARHAKSESERERFGGGPSLSSFLA